MIEPQIVNEVWPQVRFEWCVFLFKILMFLNALLILHFKYWYFASSGQSHWHLLEGVAELCVGDFLIESVHNPRKYMKKQCVFDVLVLPAAISKLDSVFFTHSAAEGRTFFLARRFL